MRSCRSGGCRCPRKRAYRVGGCRCPRKKAYKAGGLLLSAQESGAASADRAASGAVSEMRYAVWSHPAEIIYTTTILSKVGGVGY